MATMFHKTILLLMFILTLTSCEPPTRENIKIIDGHIYLRSYSVSVSYYIHDPKCPQCQKDNKCQCQL